MAPFIGVGVLSTLFALNGSSSRNYHPTPSSALYNEKNSESEQTTDTTDISTLCNLFDASPTDLLSLRTNNDNGIRGMCLTKPVGANDVILRIPLSSCLTDASPPQWLQQTQYDGSDTDSTYTVSVQGWVTRLTATLLDAYKLNNNDNDNTALQTWFDLFPTDLTQILPIHWDSNLLQNEVDSQCQALESAVDSAYFARAGVVQDLITSLTEANLITPTTKADVELCLDLVQTRSCRVESSSPKIWEDGAMRVLAPIFDMINHSPNHNAEYVRDGDTMIVRALRDIDADDEVFINYGESTEPAWKCLFSYGFVPLVEEVYDTDTAELVVDGGRFEVSPVDIPSELIRYEATGMIADITCGLEEEEDEEVEEIGLTPEIGQRIVDRLVEAAAKLESSASSKALQEREEKGSVAASVSLADLRESNRRTLLACAGGLREFLEES